MPRQERLCVSESYWRLLLISGARPQMEGALQRQLSIARTALNGTTERRNVTQNGILPARSSTAESNFECRYSIWTLGSRKDLNAQG
jgi:hypothetical protein